MTYRFLLPVALMLLISLTSHAAPPAESVLPEVDPPLEGEPPRLVDAVMAQHPRLLFGPEDVQRLRAVAASPMGEVFMERLNAFLPASRAPQEARFLTDATDGQRQGYWRLPTVALHYVLTGDARSFQRTVEFMQMLLDLEEWESGNERNSGMSAANIMIGAALAYDWLYNDLDPQFREQFRRKLLRHARLMYHGGHLNKNRAVGYWQNDPQNNHRWHRNAGMALCILAAYTGAEEEQWILRMTYDDLAFVMRWLPEDGTSHEGPTYMTFGGSHLVIALQAADRCFGTEYLQQSFIEHVGPYMLQSLLPGMEGRFVYGDSSGGPLGGYDVFLYLPATVHGQRDVQAALDRAWRDRPESFTHVAWMALLWHDPGLSEGAAEELPTRGFFDDVGLLYVRDGWTRQSAAAMFKACPFGGHLLNEFRNTRDFSYINVAHDDPDANSFVLWRNGGFLAETSRYSHRKRSSSHNTILINGMGQMSEGRPEGGMWTQPAQGSVDMTEMAYITAYRPGDEVVIIEGEAGGSYRAMRRRGDSPARPALERFRRTFIWVEGRYVLVLDDIRSSGEEVEMTWLMQGSTLRPVNEGEHLYLLAHDEAECAFQVRSDVNMEGTIAVSTADHRGQALGWQQLQLRGRGSAFRVASVYDLWGHGDVKLTLEPADDGTSQVRVEGAGVSDSWDWTVAADPRTASSISGNRDGRALAGIGPDDTIRN
jgi:hypothetical protein